MTDLTNRWYQTVRRPSESEEERDNLYNSDGYDDELFDENQNNHSFIDVGDDDDGIFADVEEGRVGMSKKSKHPSKLLKKSEKLSISGPTRKAIYKKNIGGGIPGTSSSRKNQKLFQTKPLLNKPINTGNNNDHNHNQLKEQDNPNFIFT